MGRICAILATAARNDAIVSPVSASMPLKQPEKLFFAILPIDSLLLQRESASTALSAFVDIERGVLVVTAVLEFDA